MLLSFLFPCHHFLVNLLSLSFWSCALLSLSPPMMLLISLSQAFSLPQPSLEFHIGFLVIFLSLCVCLCFFLSSLFHPFAPINFNVSLSSCPLLVLLSMLKIQRGSVVPSHKNDDAHTLSSLTELHYLYIIVFPQSFLNYSSCKWRKRMKRASTV